MQERDEELYWAYQEIDELEKAVLKKDNTILKLGIAVGILALVLLGIIVFTVLKFCGKLKFPWLKGLGKINNLFRRER